MATFSVEVSFSQLAVFASSLLHPFNDWLDRHVEQGFAWRPGSVSFRSIAEGGLHTVDLRVVDHMDTLDPQATRAIVVPFDVPEDGAIEVGSITETTPLSLPAGSYLLRCEFLGGGDGQERVRLTFGKMDRPRFEVARADSALRVRGELLTTAHAAPG